MPYHHALSTPPHRRRRHPAHPIRRTSWALIEPGDFRDEQGEAVLNAIIEGGLFEVVREGDRNIILWSANAPEQIGQAVRELAESMASTRAQAD